jgi:hypothetical protein
MSVQTSRSKRSRVSPKPIWPLLLLAAGLGSMIGAVLPAPASEGPVPSVMHMI